MPEDTETIEQPKPSAFRDALKASAERQRIEDGVDKPKAEAQPESAPPPKSPESTTKAPATSSEPEGLLPDDNDRAEGKKPAKGNDFRRVKTYAEKMEKDSKEARAKLSEYEKELADLRKRPAANADEIAKIQAERDQFKSQFEVVALELTPEFNQKYAVRQDKVHSALKEVTAPETYAKAAALIQLPESPHKQRLMTEFLEEVTPYEAQEIMAANRELRAINGERNGELANSQAKLGEIVANRQKAQQERQAQLDSLFEAEEKAALSEDPLYQLKQGDSKEVVEWNESVMERRKVAKAIFRGALKPEEMAKTSLKVASFHILTGQLQQERSRVKELEAVVAKIQGAGPGVGGNGGEQKGAGPKVSFSEMVGRYVPKDNYQP